MFRHDFQWFLPQLLYISERLHLYPTSYTARLPPDLFFAVPKHGSSTIGMEAPTLIATNPSAAE